MTRRVRTGPPPRSGAAGGPSRTGGRVLLAALQLGIDDLRERVDVARADHRDAVDEEGGGPGHAGLLAVLEILLDFILELAAVEAGLELVLLEADRRRGLDQVGRRQL